ncbi:hypothetical protein ONE63_007881 [Megalurothrips usitatus]|uniref:Uncharacterized protein n=1 Tax=Megalurothrips usitatus TaxID=439358 RepID=A0AAV7XVJ6_9NEOP|nr:hypothetical protein ONE63_007881 [Megalurothrips usitatus]
MKTPEMAVSPPLGSECRCVPLSLSHELRVDRGRLSPASPPFFSCWFGHPQGDADVWWRLVLRRQARGWGSTAPSWALELQLATTEERESVFRRQPRLHIAAPRENTSVRPELAADPVGAQTNYILRTVDARVICAQGAGVSGVRQPVLCGNNFVVLGYLGTQAPVHICDLDAGAVGRVDVDGEDGDNRRLIVRVTFTVDYHKVVPVAL